MKSTHTLSATVIGAWSALTHDANPLHTDAAYAAGTEFGRPIVQGHLLAALAMNAAQRAFGSEQLSVRCTFHTPIPVGSTVNTLEKSNDGGRVGVWWESNEVVRVEITVGATSAEAPAGGATTLTTEAGSHDESS